MFYPIHCHLYRSDQKGLLQNWQGSRTSHSVAFTALTAASMPSEAVNRVFFTDSDILRRWYVGNQSFCVLFATRLHG
jgi:hypothetical protein